MYSAGWPRGGDESIISGLCEWCGWLAKSLYHGGTTWIFLLQKRVEVSVIPAGCVCHHMEIISYYKPYANDWFDDDGGGTWFRGNSCDNMSIIWRDATMPGTRTIRIWEVAFWQPIHRQSTAATRIIWFWWVLWPIRWPKMTKAIYFWRIFLNVRKRMDKCAFKWNRMLSKQFQMENYKSNIERWSEMSPCIPSQMLSAICLPLWVY